MKVFISWSGRRSKAVAQALNEWLPDILQEATTWMSEHDIDAGARWSHKLSEVLSESHLGIVCLTPENQKAPWLLYEAGALSKCIQQSRLIPYLIAMSPSDVEAPLSQFQSVAADAGGTYMLLESVNATNAAPLPSERLRRLFDRGWPDLEARIASAVALVDTGSIIPSRSDRDILTEILELVRSSSQAHCDPAPRVPVSVSIQIDPRPLLGPEVIPFGLTLPLDANASNFLDKVWSRLNDQSEVKAYSYGTVWLLRNSRTGQVLNRIGIDYCQSKGLAQDLTPVSQLKLRDGDTLLAFSCNDTTM